MSDKFQVLPELSPEEYEELKADIQARGVLVPIELDENGFVLDGHHRLKICRELGIEDYPTVTRTGWTEAEKFTHARKLNLLRRHLTQEQRRELIRAELKQDPERSDRQIAAELGVNHETVGAQRKPLEASGEIRQIDKRKGADGRTRRTPTPPPATKAATVPHVARNGGKNEWYTPAGYIGAARKAMGGIDLDPASCAKANKTVQATKFYTKSDNGLTRKWSGRVWLNPPYSIDVLWKFVEKLAKERGNIDAAIVLVNNATETTWFARLVGMASAVCFPTGRVRFLDPEGNPGAPLQGQAVVYVGDEPEKFMEAFREFGWMARIGDGTKAATASRKARSASQSKGRASGGGKATKAATGQSCPGKGKGGKGA